MFDPRVVRGLAHGKPVVTNASKDARAAQDKASESQSRQQRLERQKLKKQLINEGVIRPSLQSVHQMHKNIVVPKVRSELKLDLYLEEQVTPTLVNDQTVQTDKLRTPPATPAYKPRKVGVDTHTQVDVDEIFNFDEAVRPLVELLLGHSFEQALAEVSFEENSDKLTKEQQALEEREKERLVAEKSLVDEEVRRNLQLQRQQRLAHERHAKQERVLAMLAAEKAASAFMSGVQKRALDELAVQGGVKDPFEAAVQYEFLPWLMQKVNSQVAMLQSAGTLLDEMLVDGLQDVQNQKDEVAKQRAIEALRAEEERIRAEAAAALDLKLNSRIQVYIDSNWFEEPLGPIDMRGFNRVFDLEAQVLEWLRENIDLQRVPTTDKLNFAYNGDVLVKTKQLYEVGLEGLSNIQLIADLSEPDAEAEQQDEDEEQDEFFGDEDL